MSQFAFGPGRLFDYYNGGQRTAFTGFPAADYNDHGSGVYVSPALTVAVVDLARWFWRVKTWQVTFSETGTVRTYTSESPDEFGLLDVYGWAFAESKRFGMGIVINAAGQYGCQADLENLVDGPITDSAFALTSAGGNTLVFTAPDPPNNTAIAVESTYWGWS